MPGQTTGDNTGDPRAADAAENVYEDVYIEGVATAPEPAPAGLFAEATRLRPFPGYHVSDPNVQTAAAQNEGIASGFPYQQRLDAEVIQRAAADVANGVDYQTQRLLNSLAELTDEDYATLQNLPPGCIVDLPGVGDSIEADDLTDHSRMVPAAGWEQPEGAVEQASHAEMFNPHANATAAGFTSSIDVPDGEDPHLEIYSRTAFPSAQECATCHEQIYEEWSSSSHAYSAISPMFHSFEQKINTLAQGTLGYFCLRCHAPVATTMGLRRDQAIWDGPKVFREGVTCVACHRVKTPFGKVNGERRMEPGDLYDPVYGSSSGGGLEIALKYDDHYKVNEDRGDTGPGQAIHRQSIQFEELSESSFCVSCHQVAVQPGIKLEVVWDQYRASPAYRAGVTCQDCHMGKVPGVDSGYSVGPAAVVSDKVVNPERRHSNHAFYGPGYSIAHPGVFPHNKDADRWTFNEWLQFDWRAGWGTDEFEDALFEGEIFAQFPPVWSNIDDRYDARDIIEVNLAKLRYKKDLRRQVMENGSKLDGPFFAEPPMIGDNLEFQYCVTNTNPGHNMPSGSLGAQPQLWLNVVLTGPGGEWVWESGYLDTNGDLADNHSLDVLARRVPFDEQLFNLQTKFLTTNVKGTDREMYLPINVDIDQLPFIRPAAQPVTVLNHPPFIRMEGHSLPPLGSRKAKFVVPGNLICEPGTYRLSVRMRSRAEPIYFMRFCESTPEMERMMNEWIVDFHTSTVTFEVH
ncbi:MAG: multiheme c-type cytochrome [Planctomycetota bacterium]